MTPEITTCRVGRVFETHRASGGSRRLDPPYYTIRQNLWCPALFPLDALMPDQPAGIDQARLDVFLFQPGVALQQDFRTVSRCEHPQHMFDRQPPAANDRLAAKYVRIHGDAFEVFRLVRWLSFCSAVDGQLEKCGQGQSVRRRRAKSTLSPLLLCPLCHPSRGPKRNRTPIISNVNAGGTSAATFDVPSHGKNRQDIPSPNGQTALPTICRRPMLPS